ncbi:CvpA family protein [Bacillus thermotolerans]|uniref:Colicin V production protein n=1 Tax=Bacillus thermotolerans TaxID=1221996 RepID=A0A0F5HPQ6_BACTR|nr:CvpA family protein [Bacillus thermotolerans]KKB34817.1 putative colicin V production protein [Bacillus thermotolerans]KKB37182.1 putative colicin V production protein [Bacillus thermotolerans]KKB43357.1 putative colicin V production protein [Bacillus thermotolerans]
MVDIVLLFFLFMGIVVGLRRGFVLQFFHIGGSLIAIIAALALRGQVAPLLEQWIPAPPIDEQSRLIFLSSGFESFYYGALAFILIFIIVKVALSILASFLNGLAGIPILREVNKIGGGLLGFVEVYLVLFVLLYLVALLPNGISTAIADSFVADYMIHRTPYLSETLKNFNLLDQLDRFSF